MIHRQKQSQLTARRQPRLLSRLCLLLLLVFLDCRALTADTNTDRRIAVGGKLFSVLLAADQQAETKVTGKGSLSVGVLYADDERAAIAAQQALPLEDVRGIDVQLSVLPLSDYLANPAPYFALFIAQRLNAEELDQLVRKTTAAGVILFSPFEGDVEKGVLAGISVQASVRPYINQHTLRNSAVDIKPFFLKVAKIHE